MTEEKLDKEELLKKLEEELEKMTVDQVMAQMAANLASLGFKYLGLPPEKYAKYKDPEQARMSIDGLESLIKILERKLSKEEIQVLKTALSNLQLLYVNVSQGTEPEQPAEKDKGANEPAERQEGKSQEKESNNREPRGESKER